MASIATAIQITDRVSAPMMSIIGALESTTRAFETLGDTMGTSMDPSAINAAKQQLAAAAEQVSHLSDEQENFTRHVKESKTEMSGLVGKIGAAVAAYASFATVNKVMDISDELTMTNARLDMMNQSFNEINGTATETADVVNMVYEAAQNARGSFGDMASVVAKFGNNAKDAFSDQKEVVRFANLVQKQMTIAGASTAEASNAMLQLSQALGSGALRGDELNSIFEQAPNLIQNIADYLDVPIGKIRSMAQEGQLTADIVKAAIFAFADDIDTKFEAMPMTWNQVWTKMTNTALMQFQPVLNKINDLANNQKFQTMVNNMLSGLSRIAVMLLNVMDVSASVASFIADNWSTIGPIIGGVVAVIMAYNAVMAISNAVDLISTGLKNFLGGAVLGLASATGVFTASETAAIGAQLGLNAAMYACPIAWIVAGIVAVIAVLVIVANQIAKTSDRASSAFGVIVGWVFTLGAVVNNIGVAIINVALAVVNAMTTRFATFANFLANVFVDPIGAIIHMFEGMAQGVLSILSGIARAIDNIFGSNLASAVSGWSSSLSGKADQLAAKYGNGNYTKVFEGTNLTAESFGLSRIAYGDAFDKGAAWGDSKWEKLTSIGSGAGFGSDFLDGLGSGDAVSSLADNVADTAGSTARAADALDVSKEELKYLHDIAERDAVNRFTTASITIQQENHNNISSEADLDGIVSAITYGTRESILAVTEGVHA